MRNINFIRLQNFIVSYAPTKKKKYYNLKKLQELETEFKQLKQELESDELALYEASEIIAELKAKNEEYKLKLSKLLSENNGVIAMTSVSN